MILKPAQVYKIAAREAPKAAQRYGVRNYLRMAEVIVAIAKKESSYNSRAKNPRSTASGLMQILEGTQKAISRRMGIPYDRSKIWDPAYSIMLALDELGYQLRRYGYDFNKAIIAYNQGNATTEKALKAGATYLAAVNKTLGSIDFAALEREDAGDIAVLTNSLTATGAKQSSSSRQKTYPEWA